MAGKLKPPPGDTSQRAIDAANRQRETAAYVSQVKTILKQVGISVSDANLQNFASNIPSNVQVEEGTVQRMLEEKDSKGNYVYGDLSQKVYNKFGKYVNAYKKAHPNQPEISYSHITAYKKGAEQVFASYGAKDLLNDDTYMKVVNNGLDVNELEARFSVAKQKIDQADPFLLAQLQKAFPGNKTKTDLLKAVMLGAEAGHNWLQTKMDVASVGASFARHGFDESLTADELLSTRELTTGQVEQRLQAAQDISKDVTKLAGIYGEATKGLGAEIANEQLGGPASQRRAKLTALEKAAFSGASGVGSTSLKTERSGMI